MCIRDRQTVTALPGHGLVDTGAQEGVCGLWHFRRWVCGLGKLFGLRPAFLPLTEGDRTGGIGGAASVVARCDMPTGIAGVNGLTRWMILDDPGEEKIPPCVPNTLLIKLDARIEPARDLVIFRRYQGDRQVTMNRLPTGHQTSSVMMLSLIHI